MRPRHRNPPEPPGSGHVWRIFGAHWRAVVGSNLFLLSTLSVLHLPLASPALLLPEVLGLHVGIPDLRRRLRRRLPPHPVEQVAQPLHVPESNLPHYRWNPLQTAKSG